MQCDECGDEILAEDEDDISNVGGQTYCNRCYRHLYDAEDYYVPDWMDEPA